MPGLLPLGFFSAAAFLTERGVAFAVHFQDMDMVGQSVE